MIEKIKVENLTVFEELEINTNAPINVFIGENGTGKTQILKFINMIYSFPHLTIQIEKVKKLGGSGRHTFLGASDLNALLRNEDSGTKFTIISNNQESIYEIFSIADGFQEEFHYSREHYLNDFEKMKIVFIPAKDMLTHSKGLPAMKKEYGRNMPFDESYINIIEKASKWNKQEVPQIAKKIVPILEDIMDGVVEIVNEVFYIKKRNGRMIPFDFEAEGVKKIGLLWQLLMSGTITKGTILLWDEPESNLNPKLTSDIANMLLELSRNGVQIFLSTHSYFLAKYFDVLENEETECMFHSLYKTENGVKCESNPSFSDLSHNLIIDESIHLYHQEIEKVML